MSLIITAACGDGSAPPSLERAANPPDRIIAIAMRDGAREAVMTAIVMKSDLRPVDARRCDRRPNLQIESLNRLKTGDNEHEIIGNSGVFQIHSFPQWRLTERRPAYDLIAKLQFTFRRPRLLAAATRALRHAQVLNDCVDQ